MTRNNVLGHNSPVLARGGDERPELDHRILVWKVR